MGLESDIRGSRVIVAGETAKWVCGNHCFDGTDAVQKGDGHGGYAAPRVISAIW